MKSSVESNLDTVDNESNTYGEAPYTVDIGHLPHHCTQLRECIVYISKSSKCLDKWISTYIPAMHHNNMALWQFSGTQHTTQHTRQVSEHIMMQWMGHNCVCMVCVCGTLLEWRQTRVKCMELVKYIYIYIVCLLFHSIRSISIIGGGGVWWWCFVVVV